MKKDIIKKKIRKIQIYPFIKNVHTANKTLFSHPPKGYMFIGDDTSKKPIIMSFFRHSKRFKPFYHAFLRLFPTDFFFNFMNKTKVKADADLILSNQIYDGNLPWVLFIFDSPYAITGHNYNLFIKNKDKIERALLVDRCKKIICCNESSLEVLKNFFHKNILKKTQVIHPGISIPENLHRRENKNKKITLLFMGSINNPHDFYIKGGLEVINVFEKLQEKNKCSLIIRCRIPEKLRKRINQNKDIKLIENQIPFKEIKKIYESSDILLSPAHVYVLMSTLEAMSFGLPIIALDAWGVKDYIKNNYNGLIVKKSDKISVYKQKDYLSNLRTKRFVKELEKVDEEVIKRIYDKLRYLIDNPDTRIRLGKNARKFIQKEFAIKQRNQKLKKIFDEIFYHRA